MLVQKYGIYHIQISTRHFSPLLGDPKTKLNWVSDFGTLPLCPKQKCLMDKICPDKCHYDGYQILKLNLNTLPNNISSYIYVSKCFGKTVPMLKTCLHSAKVLCVC